VVLLAALKDKIEEFHASLCGTPEVAQHRTGYGPRVLLLHSAHLHTHVLSLNNNPDSNGLIFSSIVLAI